MKQLAGQFYFYFYFILHFMTVQKSFSSKVIVRTHALAPPIALPGR